jgi:phosphoribosylanthranilate isomerase
MTMPYIKICGIKDPKTAYYAIKFGAHYIGLIFHPPSPRYVDVYQAKKIAHVVKKHSGEPVGVFVNQTQNEIIEICEKTQLNIVQLHGNHARSACSYLPDHITRIYVLHISKNGQILNDENLDYIQLNPTRDFLLFDNELHYQGQEINLNKVDLKKFKFNYFIAGGLNHLNVKQFIFSFQPFGIDVSSAVENARGKKDLCLIKKFIDEGVYK